MYGGEPISEHVEKLKGLKPPHIIVGTPGRIKQLTKQKDLDLSNLQIFVLDECDKMLEEISKEVILNFRHERRCVADLQGHSTLEASHDVLSYYAGRGETSLQEVYEESL